MQKLMCSFHTTRHYVKKLSPMQHFYEWPYMKISPILILSSSCHSLSSQDLLCTTTPRKNHGRAGRRRANAPAASKQADRTDDVRDKEPHPRPSSRRSPEADLLGVWGDREHPDDAEHIVDQDNWIAT